MKTWERSLATITIPVGAVDWSRISMPPPVNHPWTCRKALQGIPQLGERDEDGDASSDDDDGVELEPVAELEDVRFLGDLDCLIGLRQCRLPPQGSVAPTAALHRVVRPMPEASQWYGIGYSRVLMARGPLTGCTRTSSGSCWQPGGCDVRTRYKDAPNTNPVWRTPEERSSSEFC
ncbi:hypothetical protein BS47DRAFT_1364932 [Hydnum rufescens UP504]|uniref:Uncharacterized protein n=1 Tax=Hydnum rufescens UP504 TaxID=1448309 RepID=A0A9P6AQR2_9AGAM|nr:hypothetical protein BS47DRAFT_1364932 [Hydnum rufescens UP504]